MFSKTLSLFAVSLSTVLSAELGDLDNPLRTILVADDRVKMNLKTWSSQIGDFGNEQVFTMFYMLSAEYEMENHEIIKDLGFCFPL